MFTGLACPNSHNSHHHKTPTRLTSTKQHLSTTSCFPPALISPPYSSIPGLLWLTMPEYTDPNRSILRTTGAESTEPHLVERFRRHQNPTWIDGKVSQMAALGKIKRTFHALPPGFLFECKRVWRRRFHYKCKKDNHPHPSQLHERPLEPQGNDQLRHTPLITEVFDHDVQIRTK
jgi:hypothetical protein